MIGKVTAGGLWRTVMQQVHTNTTQGHIDVRDSISAIIILKFKLHQRFSTVSQLPARARHVAFTMMEWPWSEFESTTARLAGLATTTLKYMGALSG